MQRPPSTSMATPVIMLASSEHRKAAALPMSSGVEKRPIGIVDRNFARRERTSARAGSEPNPADCQWFRNLFRAAAGRSSSCAGTFPIRSSRPPVAASERAAHWRNRSAQNKSRSWRRNRSAQGSISSPAIWPDPESLRGSQSLDIRYWDAGAEPGVLRAWRVAVRHQPQPSMPRPGFPRRAVPSA